MKQSHKILLALVLVAIIVGISIWKTPPSTIPNETTNTATSAKTVGIMTDATLGTYLAATNGMTLYTFTRDTPGVSNCSGVCITNWPAYIVDPAGLSAPAEASGALGTITRADGNIQLTYNQMPLYFWHGDSKPGDTTGNNVGGVWFVAKP